MIRPWPMASERLDRGRGDGIAAAVASRRQLTDCSARRRPRLPAARRTAEQRPPGTGRVCTAYAVLQRTAAQHSAAPCTARRAAGIGAEFAGSQLRACGAPSCRIIGCRMGRRPNAGARMRQLAGGQISFFQIWLLPGSLFGGTHWLTAVALPRSPAALRTRACILHAHRMLPSPVRTTFPAP